MPHMSRMSRHEAEPEQAGRQNRDLLGVWSPSGPLSAPCQADGQVININHYHQNSTAIMVRHPADEPSASQLGIDGVLGPLDC